MNSKSFLHPLRDSLDLAYTSIGLKKATASGLTWLSSLLGRTGINHFERIFSAVLVPEVAAPTMLSVGSYSSPRTEQ
jgi:hypothetical protein